MDLNYPYRFILHVLKEFVIKIHLQLQELTDK